MDFSDKAVLITGGSGGIGKGIAQKFKQAGAKIALVDLKFEGETFADACFTGDITDADYVQNLPQKTIDALGGLDVIVNNAGVMRRGKITDSSDADFDVSVAVNIKAPFQLCRAAIPLMAKNGGGAIVNIASCWGVHAGADHAIYCMSKAALASLTQCMGRDHAHQNIRINAVCPNEVDTPMLRTGFELRGFNPETAIAELGKTVPLGRVSTPDDIAEIVLFLASDHARYMCGSLVEVNGGKAVS